MKKISLLGLVVVSILAAACSGAYAGDAHGITVPNMNTEADIREYLAGEWYFHNTSDRDYSSCRMVIDKNLKAEFFFADGNKKSKGHFIGQFSFNRIYAEAHEAPDLLCLELPGNSKVLGGDFFFLHRTVFDKRRVMSLFSAGNGGCLFDLLDQSSQDEWGGISPVEMLFIKKTGEEYQLAPRANAEFYAVCWGESPSRQNRAIWLDDIQWPPPGPYDIEEIGSDTWYRYLTTKYNNKTPISVPYLMADGMKIQGGGDLRQGEVYLVKTNARGEISSMRKADASSLR